MIIIISIIIPMYLHIGIYVLDIDVYIYFLIKPYYRAVKNINISNPKKILLAEAEYSYIRFKFLAK